MGRDEVDALYAQRDGDVNLVFDIIDKENLRRFDRGPFDCLLINFDCRFFKPNLVG